MTPIQFSNQPPTPTLGRYTGDAAQRAFARAVGRTFRPVRYRGGFRNAGGYLASMDEGDVAAQLNVRLNKSNVWSNESCACCLRRHTCDCPWLGGAS